MTELLWVPLSHQGFILLYRSDRSMNKSFPLLFILLFTSFSLGVSSTSAFAKPKCNPLQRSLAELQSHFNHYSAFGKLPDRAEDFEELFRLAEDKYYKKIDFKEMKMLFKKVSEGGLKAISPNELDILRKNRIYAQKVRGSYTLFSEGHSRPKQFQKFVRDFGYLNDALIEGRGKDAKKIAVTVLKHMKNGYHLTRPLGFTPAQSGSIVRYSLKTFEWVEGSLGVPIDLHHYHDVRKKIRDFKFLYAMLNKHYPNPEYIRLGEKAGKISDEMGAVKDILFTDNTLQKSDKVVIDPKFEQVIREFIAEFKATNIPQ